MITASIVIYKTKEVELRTVIDCALRSTISMVYVIDNSPENNLQRVVDDYKSSNLVYIYGHGNIGYGAAHNIAINKAIDLGSKYHVILNPDIIFADGVIESLSLYMDKNPKIGSVMPNIVYPDGTLQKLCKLLPTPYDILVRRLFPRSWNDKRNEKYEMHFMGYDKSWNCPNLSGCFMFLRVEVLKLIGGFDDRFFMYFEDTDLIRRIHKMSITAFYPEVTIIHAHKAEHRTNKKLLKISIQSAIKYFNKYGWLFDKERRLFNKNCQLDTAQIID